MNIKRYAPWNWRQDEKKLWQNVPANTGQGQLMSGFPTSQLHREIDRLFDETLRGFPKMFHSDWEWPEMTSLTLKPNLDIKDTDEKYIVSIEIPGVSKEDVDIRIEGNNLTVYGEKKQEKRQDKENYHCIERHYGSFERMLTLPQDADTNNVDASFKDGVLTVNIKRKAISSTKEGKRIEVKAAA